MNLIAKSALSCALLLALSACGNKGPLVLPEKPAPVIPAPAAEPDADPAKPASDAEKGAALPVQIKSEPATTAPTSGDQKADKALDDGADGDG